MKSVPRGFAGRSFEDAPLRGDEERPDEKRKSTFTVGFDYPGNPSGIVRAFEILFSVTCAVCAAILSYMYPIWLAYRFPYSGLAAGTALLLFTSVTALIWLLILYVMRTLDAIRSIRCFILSDMILSSLWLLLYLTGSILAMAFITDRTDPVQIVAATCGFATSLALGLNLAFLFIENRLQP